MLRQEGFIKLDRRKGAVIAVDINKIQAIEKLRGDLTVILARSICKDVTRSEVHELVDEIYDYYARKCED